MNTHMVIELKEEKGVQTVLSAIEAYKARLQTSIARTQRRLKQFEEKYGVATDDFLKNMTAEEMEGGDIEYVEWAGEAKILAGLQEELTELTDVRYQLH
ncbi:hypothetical protein MNBD_CHLOROFLEXI01-2738 [hydrothermal vent metagenome]|uniref:Uncharacterized protein n=1 Tax=hydrothermal vent metagenome TaxID=652676 RepID=A0A3B0UR41_9ZZZZ